MTDPASPMHPEHDRVLKFIASPDEERFEPLALDVFRHQFEHVAAYRAHCERRGATPATVRRWTDVPPVPISAFKITELSCGSVERRFRSTGTTRGVDARSVHALPDLRLYRASAVAGLRRFLFPDVPAMRLLSLIHPAADLPESSLAQMVAWGFEDFAAPGSAYAVRADSIDAELAADVVRASERDGAPLCILATTAALVRVLDEWRERDWSFRLTHGSRVMDTGGAKGAPRTLSRKGLLHAIWSALAVPGYLCTNEYGMCELSSQAWENVIADRIAGRVSHRAHTTPPWMRTRVLDPATLGDTPAGARGLLCHYDLANAGTAMAVLTEDVGRAVPDGFEVLGRASGAEMRGCSLAWAGS